ncbi:regulator of sigma-E protease RseP [mine drainage metagenome]|uniref:Regulator of sigma-E protease RseP n=1 Tax=mine drainage metagenome TaxID=410659 RepID=A0A1J5R081_9ZZZZ
MAGGAGVTTLLAFLVTLGVLIVVHEYGHYRAAKLCGVKVLQFSIGFGRALHTWRIGRDGTEFILAAFPLGGFVRMLDEREAPVEPHELSRAFNRQSVGRRMLIVAAGPLANLLLAVLLYWVLFMSGLPGLRPLLGEAPAGTPAAQASMKAGELIVRVGRTAVATWQDVRWALLQESFRARSVEIEARSGPLETHLHHLDLGAVSTDDGKADLLDQLGLAPMRPVLPARVGEVQPGGAAEQAGLRVGDDILSVNEVAVSRWEDFASQMRSNPGRPVRLEVRRNGAVLQLGVTPVAVSEGGAIVGRIGAAYRMAPEELGRLMVNVQYAPLPAFWHAAVKTWDTSIFSLKMLGSMLTGASSWKGVSGPVTIASYAGQSAHLGWKAFLGFLALVSISLGVLNLLPVPVLDGGHLMYHVVEILTGRPVSEHVMEIGQKAGIAVLGLLMAIAFYNDINRLITG